MGEYYLRQNVLGGAFKLPITAAQYEDLDDAATTHWEALYLEQKFDFVVENYLEFEETLLRRGLEYMILKDERNRRFERDTSTFNRRIMNLLTTITSYVDTYEQHLNRIFHRDADVVRQAKEFFSAEYDSRVGYWMIPKLRNFVQHQGFPVHGSSYGSRWVKNENNESLNRYTIDLYLTPEELSKGKFSKEVLSRFQKMSEKIDLKFLIRDFMEGFSAAHVKARQLLSSKLEWAECYIESAEECFVSAAGDSSTVALAAFSSDPGVNPVYLHYTIANDQRKYLVKKNGQLVKLASRYISSEISSSHVEIPTK